MKRCLPILLKSRIVLSYYKQQISIQGILYLKALPLFIFYFGIASTMAYLSGKYIEACFQVVAFLFLRYKFNSTYHASTMRNCFFITLSVILLSIPTIPALCNTLFGGIMSAFLVSFFSWLAQYIVELKTPQPVKYDFLTINEADLRVLCRNKGLSSENTELAVEFFVKKTKHSILADRLCVEEKSITTRKKRLKKKLFG